MSASSVTVMELVAFATGVLCSISFFVKVGLTTRSGCSPLPIPYFESPGLAISALAIEPMLLEVPSVSAASTLTEGDAV